MIFNTKGQKITTTRFFIDNKELIIADSYTYLGMVFKPSGSVTQAISELHTKANKSWFAISNVVYQNKKMPITRALQLFDSLVTPVSLYASDFWTPLCIPSANFSNSDELLKSWMSFSPETINQKMCRMVLGVHKKSSRLAVLGELGRYPLFFRALIHSLKYEWHLAYKSDTTSLAYLAFLEMDNDPNMNDWLGKIRKIRHLLEIPLSESFCSVKSVGKKKNYLNNL